MMEKDTDNDDDDYGVDDNDNDNEEEEANWSNSWRLRYAAEHMSGIYPIEFNASYHCRSLFFRWVSHRASQGMPQYHS